MLTIVEIVLTVAAWRKGWGARALLPLGCSLSFAFILGLIVGATGSSVITAQLITVGVDLVITGVLIWMIVRSPERAQVQGVAEAAGQADMPAESVDERGEIAS